MIRINLVQSQVAPIAEAGIVGDIIYTPAELRKQGLFRFILIIIFPLGLWFYQESTVPDLIRQRDAESKKLRDLKAYNAQMEKSVQEIKKFKEDEAKIQARIAYMEKLSKDRFREIKVLDLVQQVIPEKVWLTRVESTDGRIVVTGMAMTDFEISSFMEALAKSVHFVDVNLLSSSEMLYDGLNVKRFEIAGLMERPSQ